VERLTSLPRSAPFTRAELEQSLASRFEQQVARYPQRLAIKSRHHALTYAELNQAANRLAHAILVARGPGAEPVALLFAPGAPAITAMLGVLKAGKIYVPMTPSDPPARLAYLLEDSQAALLVTNCQHAASARPLTRERLPVLKTDELDLGLSAENPDLAMPPDALAYIMYTSGSTGQPKGVVDNHRNVLHHMMRVTNEFRVCAEDRQTLLRSYSFNGAIRDIFGALLNGAALYPLDLETEGMTHLAEWLAEEEITIYRSVISVFRRFAGNLSGTEQFPRLRLVHVGGEPVYRADVDLYRQHFAPECVFLAGLGITEVGTTRHYYIDHQLPLADAVVPAGYAVEDMEACVLDDDGHEAGFDTTGELAIRSRYLALGYWRRPELTQAKFVPDPREPGVRTYLTGDLALMRPDGCILHLGRQDFQVKISGHRVETTEVEAALLGVAGVEQAFVMLREDRPGEPQLVAYVVPGPTPAPTVSALRRALAQRLPSIMIPSAFVTLEALPFTAYGKVDRRALPAPDRARPALEQRFVAPRTPLEEQLARIWADVLGLDQVGIDDSFLELGGHSLTAGQIVTQVLRTFGIDVSVSVLLEAATVARMAVLIAQSRAEAADPQDIATILDAVERLPDDAP
jgi:amino acid adenylation domain-containing protein